ncbi:hypothetical protein DY000_02064327 [Brassica cretica]|uniref:Phosphoglycerate kinase n=1 Tax=Brassica cretica TaxID=69181 RepID=A0ABQ7ANJ8_BRACR|nr:hypothetical protein DY000_02064327 [Brassica cretica]
MGTPRHQQPFQHSMEPGYGNNETVPQAGSTSANFRAPNPNALDVKQVLNYSIQTGEEFALEFMRDRVNPQRSSNPNAAGESTATGFMDLRGLIEISHTGSDNAENGLRGKLGHVQSAPQASVSKDSSLGNLLGYSSSSASGSVIAKVKIFCSFGGKILPRPGDSKLRYVGGETHIISVRKDISWLALRQKVLEVYYQTHVVKYQLPGEDLDALVSVTCEEDLQNIVLFCSAAMATKRSVGTLKEADLKGKSVFVRVDLNVPLDDNSNITDDTRIRAAVPTIKYLMGNGSRVVLCSHLGRPKGVTPKFSLKPLVPRLSELLGYDVDSMLRFRLLKHLRRRRKGICMLVPSLILRCGPDASSQAWTKDHIDMIYDVDESLVRAA